MFLQNKFEHEKLDCAALSSDGATIGPGAETVIQTDSTQTVASSSIGPDEQAAKTNIIPARAIVNFLDIPMAGSSAFSLPTEGLDPLPNIHTSNCPDHPITTPPPFDDLRWALCGSKWAISDAHVDAAGFGTYVRPILGTKIWFIGVPDSEEPESCVMSHKLELDLSKKVRSLRMEKRSNASYKIQDAFPPTRRFGESDKKSFRPIISMKTGYEITAMRWVPVVLEKGDDL